MGGLGASARTVARYNNRVIGTGHGYNLMRRPGKLVHATYPVLRDQEFTSDQAAQIIGRQGRATGATLGALANRGVVERVSGERRCHYASTRGPTYWRFTNGFKQYYDTKYPGIVKT